MCTRFQLEYSDLHELVTDLQADGKSDHHDQSEEAEAADEGGAALARGRRATSSAKGVELCVGVTHLIAQLSVLGLQGDLFLQRLAML